MNTISTTPLKEILNGVSHCRSFISALVQIIQYDLFRAFPCAGIGKIAYRDIVLTHHVYHFIKIGMRHRIGLNPHNIRIFDYIRMRRYIPSYKPHIAKQRLDRLAPRVVAADDAADSGAYHACAHCRKRRET